MSDNTFMWVKIILTCVVFAIFIHHFYSLDKRKKLNETEYLRFKCLKCNMVMGETIIPKEEDYPLSPYWTESLNQKNCLYCGEPYEITKIVK